MDKKSVYLETSVVSYYTARPSRDLIVAAHQQITQEWWETSRKNYEIYISQYVTDEAGAGDPVLAEVRLKALDSFIYLATDPLIAELSKEYMKATGLPEKARLDTLHMSTASFYETDIMLSWNCKHIVNPHVIQIISAVNDSFGVRTPVICTPEPITREQE